MAEWLFEAGIGEDRAALVENGAIVEIRIDRHDGRPRAGAATPAKMLSRWPNSDRTTLALLDHGDLEAVGAVTRSFTEGQRLLVTIVREAIPERGNPKPPIVRPADPEAAAAPGPPLLETLNAGTSGNVPTRTLSSHAADDLEALGWSDHLAEAESGLISFPGGLLRLSLTPAMTLFDIDGTLPAADLAVAGAAAAARAIRLFDIGGSIGLDLPLPQSAGKPLKHAIAEQIDAILPQPFERTAVNGFGFLQIVRRRIRPSLPELLQSDPVVTAALALLRQAERAAGRGGLTLHAPSVVIRRLALEQPWLDNLADRRGAPVHLSAAADAAISHAYVQTEHP